VFPPTRVRVQAGGRHFLNGPRIQSADGDWLSEMLRSPTIRWPGKASDSPCRAHSRLRQSSTLGQPSPAKRPRPSAFMRDLSRAAVKCIFNSSIECGENPILLSRGRLFRKWSCSPAARSFRQSRLIPGFVPTKLLYFRMGTKCGGSKAWICCACETWYRSRSIHQI